MPNRQQFESNEAYNAYFQKYRDKNREKMRTYNREYNKKWRQVNGYHNEENSKKRYPEKLAARRLLQYAVKTGKIIKENCKICGSTNTQGHHPDYLKPLKVLWLCPVCHTKIHRGG